MRRAIQWAMAAGGLCASLWAQAPRPPESLTSWQFYKDIQVPAGTASGLMDFVLDADMLGPTRADLADVRLYRESTEIPYVLRVRREVDTQEGFTAREFNRSVTDGAAQVSCDLGPDVQEHNQVGILAGGSNFRRLADVEGSPDGEHWSTLVAGALLFRFGAVGRTAEQSAVSYPVSRFRYLRVRVYRDPQVDHGPPELQSVSVRRTVHRKGEMVSFPVVNQGREPDRMNGREASVWRLTLPARIPFERLTLTVFDNSFSRPFQLDSVDDPSAPSLIASGDLLRREGASPQTTIAFGEHGARLLKLTVTDDRNPPLTLSDVSVLSAAREVIFEATNGPLRVYYGNPSAAAPHYDLETRIPAEPESAPLRVSIQGRHENPVYTPGERPFSERAPWAVYLVLGVATVVLGWILLGLVRQSSARATT